MNALSYNMSVTNNEVVPMGLVAFDTLKYAEKLEKSGMSREQATAQAEAQAEILSELLVERLATKEDLKTSKTDLEGQISGLRKDLDKKMDSLKEQILELKVEFTQAHANLMRSMIGLLAGSVGFLSVLMTLFKFLG